MKKLICTFLLANAIFVMPGVSMESDPMDFDNFAILDSEDPDISIETVSLNMGASPVAVNNFDIAGIMLGMNFDQVEQTVRANGLYAPRKKNAVIYTISPDWKNNLDYECRQQKIYAPEALERCINTLAKNRGLLYASEYHLYRESTGETIVVYFTSNATDNTVWKIVYNNDVDLIEGDNPKFSDQRDKKLMAFWQNVISKYGQPNSNEDKWLSSSNSYDPMMTAYYDSLELCDNGRYASDSAKNVSQSRDNFISKSYAF